MLIKVKDWNYINNNDLTRDLLQNKFYVMEYDVNDVHLTVCLKEAKYIEIKGYQPGVDLHFVIHDYLADLNHYIDEKYGKFVVEI